MTPLCPRCGLGPITTEIHDRPVCDDCWDDLYDEELARDYYDREDNDENHGHFDGGPISLVNKPHPMEYQMVLNYYAFTATRCNSYRAYSLQDKEIGDIYYHSIYGKGIVVHVVPPRQAGGARMLLVRKDITLEQLIDVL